MCACQCVCVCVSVLVCVLAFTARTHSLFFIQLQRRQASALALRVDFCFVNCLSSFVVFPSPFLLLFPLHVVCSLLPFSLFACLPSPSFLAQKVASQPHAAPAQRGPHCARLVRLSHLPNLLSLSLTLSLFIPLCTCPCPACARFGQNFCCFCLLWYLFLPHTLPARQLPLATLFLPPPCEIFL